MKTYPIVNALLEKGAFADLLALAENAPDAVTRTKLMGSLLTQSATINSAKKVIKEQQLWAQLIAKLRDEKDIAIKQACLLEVFSDGQLLLNLAREGHIE